MIFYQEQSTENEAVERICYRNFQFPPHLHRNAEIAFVTEGTVAVCIDGEKTLLHPHEFAMILPDQVHSYEDENPSAVWVCVFSPECVPAFWSFLGESVGTKAVIPLPQETEAYLRYCLEAEKMTGMAHKSWLYALCDLYLKDNPLKERESDGDALHALFNRVQMHFTEDIKLEAIARELGYEPHYLSRLFHKTVHMHFRRFLNSRRISYAQRLLLNSELPITEIAMRSGFQNIRSFNHVFKEETGQTPRAYRQSVRIK